MHNASLSCDLDNLWSYLKTHGDTRWTKYPSYLNAFCKRFLDILDAHQLKISFFVVGKDASIHRELILEIARRGHEIGNHSFHHDAQFAFQKSSDIEREIESTDDAIKNAAGIKPVGFRGPAFTWTPPLLKILKKHGYEYQSTTFPTPFAPCIRYICNRLTSLNRAQKKERSKLFGNDGFRPQKPYLWELSKDDLLMEFPITTIPILRLPFHMSYLIALWESFPKVARNYLRFAIFSCKNLPPNFLIHPTDLLGYDLVPEMKFFPGMSLSTEKKMEIMHEVLEMLKQAFPFQMLKTRCQALKSLPIRRISPYA